jgi:hypothetical protein
VPIMLLVPLRHWALPRFFRQPRHLQDLDAAQEEEAAGLTREQALQVRPRSRKGQPCASFGWLVGQYDMNPLRRCMGACIDSCRCLRVLQEAAAQGLAASPAGPRDGSGRGGGGGSGAGGGGSGAEEGVEGDDSAAVLDSELHHFRVVHHLRCASVSCCDLRPSPLSCCSQLPSKQGARGEQRVLPVPHPLRLLFHLPVAYAPFLPAVASPAAASCGVLRRRHTLEAEAAAAEEAAGEAAALPCGHPSRAAVGARLPGTAAAVSPSARMRRPSHELQV